MGQTGGLFGLSPPLAVVVPGRATEGAAAVVSSAVDDISVPLGVVRRDHVFDIGG